MLCGSGNDPLRRAERSAFGFSTIRDCFEPPTKSKNRLFDEPRRWTCLSPFADDCRLPPLCFECLAKMVRLRI